MLILENSVSASITGFENPTLTFRKQALNLNQMFVHSPSSMFLVESKGELIYAGIAIGDWLLIDASRKPLMNDIVLVEQYDEQYCVEWSQLYSHMKSTCNGQDDLLVIGVVTISIHHFRKPISLPRHDNLTEIDLHSLLIDVEYSTLICKADGESMKPYIFHHDLMLLERHLKPDEDDVCILALNHDLVCKRVHLSSRVLSSDNPAYSNYRVTESDYLRLHGVVRVSFRLHRGLLCMGS
ncbi:S24 family peptidase [Vibrio chagasii]|uniref:S24 family peptidase n=1 Tax=Vibrio chagasii TaxID=170679 RepID=A0A7Y4DTX8_9VIBR|nr:S24 family peptidase [Vibrio chagasii]NOH36534.1 S24 family peptidase [Vibrio chagasii]